MWLLNNGMSGGCSIMWLLWCGVMWLLWCGVMWLLGGMCEREVK